MFIPQILEEKLGYERWILRESVLAVEKGYGIEPDSTLVFHVNGSKTHKIELYEEFGSEKRIEVLEKLSPLLFVTSYKVLDMIFEWILEENVENVPFHFSKKIKTYESDSKLPDFKYPEPLNNEEQLLQVLFSLYKELAIYRNKIIHGNWGTNVNGNLFFSFKDKGVHYELNVSFKDVINLSESVSLVADQLISESSNNESVYSTVKFLLDKLQHLHKSTFFNILKPRHFKVEYELSDNTVIDIKAIHDYLRYQSFDMYSSFTLLILSKAKKWLLPWNVVKNMDSIDIIEDWAKYQL